MRTQQDGGSRYGAIRRGVRGLREFTLRGLYQRYRPVQARLTGRPNLPLRGYPPAARARPMVVDDWEDHDLARVNDLLDWRCFTVDNQGRRIGQPGGHNKRDKPQPVPDPRIVQLHSAVDLSSQHVLEVGCFEGVHTVALCDLAQRVTAVDSRVDNLVKTAVRCWLYGHSPQLLLVDLEREPAGSARLACDVLHHNGVLYHLKDPVAHLRRVLPLVRNAVLLDTHVAADDEATEEYLVDGDRFMVKRFREGAPANPFAGMYDFARWMRLDDLKSELARNGFGRIVTESLRHERNGSRVHLVATRTE